MAYIGLEPKSSHTFKYSQPLELVIFHIIAIRIKSLKGSYYPHLLNNYLINYLNFSGLTNETTSNTTTKLLLLTLQSRPPLQQHHRVGATPPEQSPCRSKPMHHMSSCHCTVNGSNLIGQSTCQNWSNLGKWSKPSVNSGQNYKIRSTKRGRFGNWTEIKLPIN